MLTPKCSDCSLDKTKMLTGMTWKWVCCWCDIGVKDASPYAQRQEAEPDA